MVRVLGAALVAAGGAVLGFQAAAGLRRQARALEQMAQGLLGLEGELEITAPPLPRLMERCAGRSEGPARELFASCAQGLERLDREELSALWRRLVEERTELGPEGQAVLAPLGEVLGRYEADRQREALSTARRRLEEMADGLPICKGCFTGKYPMEPPKEDIRGSYEK